MGWGDSAYDENQTDIGAYRDRPKRSIWDDGNPDDGGVWDDDKWTPYSYKKPDEVEPFKPQGFWGADGSGGAGREQGRNPGNPFWGAPAPGSRWGDDPTGGYDPRTGTPDAPQGDTEEAGWLQWTRKQEKKYDDLVKKYKKVRHPGIFMKRKIKKDLRDRMPKSEARKVMRDGNWL